MILIKDGIEREIIGAEVIKIFKDAGWEEKKIVEVIKTETKEEIKEQPKPKKTSKKKK